MNAGVTSAVGRTPIVRLANLETKYGIRSEVYAKLEFMNPLGSVKDRIASALIDEMIAQKRLAARGVVVEASSGNTGIALSAAAASRGFRCVIVVPEGVSSERTKMLCVLGARLVFAGRGIKDAIRRAGVFVDKLRGLAVIANQFESKANSEAHRRTTAREILQSMKSVDYFVAGVGTGGTITGVGEVLKHKHPGVKVVAVEPWNSPVLSGGCAGAHGIQGIGAGFLPSVVNTSIIDYVFKVKDHEAVASAKELAVVEGIAAGLSAGAAVCAGIYLAQRVDDPAKRVLIMLPSSAERYLSTDLFKLS
ncbi:MAG: PLP-dependent cysteine synthase family protein [Candidatus Hodgkinia cicadicola]